MFTSAECSENVSVSADGQLRAGKQAVRIKRVKEPLLLTLCSSSSDELENKVPNSEENSFHMPKKKKHKGSTEVGPNMVLDTELYEGVVSQPIIEPKVSPLFESNRGRSQWTKETHIFP